VVFTTPDGVAGARSIVTGIRSEEESVGRVGPALRVFADLVVFLDADGPKAQERKDALDESDGRSYRSDAHVFIGTPADLVDLLAEWQTAGLDGFRLRPGALPVDLEVITRQVVPLARERGLSRPHPDGATLRSASG